MKDTSQRVDDTIGSTPVVKLSRLAEGRTADGMIDDAEKRGLIEPGRSTLVEPTSGNTGIAIAMIGAARGYRVILTMPESMSIERRKLLASYGAELVLTPKADGMRGAVETAERIAAETEGGFIPRQFDNPANPQAHYETTGPEIAGALGDSLIGAFVAGVGTGGTITGAGRYLRERYPDVLLVAVEPAESPIITQRLAGEALTPGPHGIQGIGANFIPSVLDLGLLSEVQRVSSPEAIDTARRMAAEEGLFVGVSSGASIAAALRIAAHPELAGTTIVAVAPDTGERYLSTPLW